MFLRFTLWQEGRPVYEAVLTQFEKLCKYKEKILYSVIFKLYLQRKIRKRCRTPKTSHPQAPPITALARYCSSTLVVRLAWAAIP